MFPEFGDSPRIWATLSVVRAPHADMADNVAFSLSDLHMSKTKTPAGCPCGGPSLATCCGPYLDGTALPPTAEALMRSRYTAYTLKNEPYLLATWHPSTRPATRIVDP